MSEGKKRIYTIGHSNIPLKDLMAVLKKYKIEYIGDVRAKPWSKYVPHFNRENFEKNCRSIKYEWAGKVLGNYGQEELGKEGQSLLKTMVDCGQDYNIVLMCSEREYVGCHRNTLLKPVLDKLGAEVYHINSKTGELF